MKISGQRVVIKIHNYEYLEKKIWLYKYEFYSGRKKSWVYSEHKISSHLSLDRGKIYLIRVNTDKNRPWILKAKEINESQLEKIDVSE
jgi:hypothetical protein